jgi:antitoxin MazE5
VPQSLDHAPEVAYVCHTHGMPRTRVSTTVDEKLLRDARHALSPATDAALLDSALAALLGRYRASEVDAAYVAYEEHPLDDLDAWGDLASFREAASGS